jgi:hypothetical protein
MVRGVVVAGGTSLVASQTPTTARASRAREPGGSPGRAENGGAGPRGR